jgi:hypothetical protein
LNVPNPEEEPDAARALLARQPAFSMFALFLLCTVTIAAALQLANLPFGVIFSEIFFFAGPVVLWTRASGLARPVVLHLRLPRAPLIPLGLLIGGSNFMVAGTLQVIVRALLPADLARRYDAMRLFRDVAGLDLWALIIAIALVAPACEELAFRGYLQTVLRSRFRDLTAVLVTALLFAGLHLDPVGLVARVELGCLFGMLTLWSGSIWPAVAAHLANNAIASGLLVLAMRRGESAQEGSDFAPGVLVAALAATSVTAWLVSAFRTQAGGAKPLVEGAATAPREPGAAGRALAAWALAGAAALALFAALGWRGAAVNFTDATNPTGDLERRLPDPHEREQFRSRLGEARRDARDGRLALHDYLALRRELAARDRPLSPLTRETLERAFARQGGASPDAGASDAGAP